MKKTKKPKTPTPPTAPAADPRLHDFEVMMRTLGPATVRMVDLPPVRCVQTLFPGLDRAIELPGWPLQSFSVIHGPPSDGKTAFCVALMAAFQRVGCQAELVDAELTSDPKFFEGLGLDLSTAAVTQPGSYEEVMEHYRSQLAGIRAGLRPGKGKNRYGAQSAFLSILDSMSKAMPREVLDKFGKDHQAVREAGMLQAAWNKHFVNVLNPSMLGLPIAVVAVLHEGEGQRRGNYTPIRVKGGNAPRFEARLQIRVKAVGFEKVGERKVAKVHEASVWKNKLGHHGARTRFFTATPEGLDLGLRPLDLALSLYESARDAGLVRPRTEKVGPAKRIVGLDVAGQEGGDRAYWVELLREREPEYRRVAAAVRAAPLARGTGTGRRDDDGPSGAALLPPRVGAEAE